MKFSQYQLSFIFLTRIDKKKINTNVISNYIVLINQKLKK